MKHLVPVEEVGSLSWSLSIRGKVATLSKRLYKRFHFKLNELFPANNMDKNCD